MAAVIGALRGLLSLESAAFESGAKRAKASMGDVERSMVRMGSRIEGVGRKMTLGLTLPMAGAATVAVKSSLKVIDAQAKMAQSLGTTVQSMQVLDRAADLSGVSMGEVQQATIQLTKRLSEAAGGTGAAAKALTRLHLSATDLQRLPLDERLAKVQSALGKYVPDAERAAVATDLFGSRAGLLFTRIDGATLRTAAEDVKRFGVAVSEVDADQIERTNDAITRLGLVGRGVSNQLAVGLAPTLEYISDGAAGAAEWFNDLGDRTKQFLSVGAALTAGLGPMAIGLGLVLKMTVPLVSGMVGLMTSVALAPIRFAAVAKSAVAMSVAFGTSTARAAVLALSIKGLTLGLGALRVAAMATGIGAVLVGSVALYQAFQRGRNATKDYEVAVEGLADAHNVLNAATETFYANMTAKNAEAMRQAAEAARDTTREALEAARVVVDTIDRRTPTGPGPASLYERKGMKEARAEVERMTAALDTAEDRLLAAEVASALVARELGQAADSTEDASDASIALANGLGQASGQAATLRSFLSALPGAIAGAQANIAGLQAGMAVLAGGGGEAAANVAKYRAELLASVGPLEQIHDGQRRAIEEGIDQRVALYAQEQNLREQYQKQVSSLNKVKSAGGSASRSAVSGIAAEIQYRKKLLGLTDQQRKQLEAVRSIQQKLGKEARSLSKAQIESMAAQVVELDNTEDSLERVNDMQRQWSEQITRTAFEGGSLGDTIKGMLRDIAYQFAHSRIVLPVVASVTGFLGLGGLMAGGGSAAAAVAGGGGFPAGGLLGGALGSSGGGLLGGGMGGLVGGLGSTTGFLGGVGNVLGGLFGAGGTAGGLTGAISGLTGSIAGATGGLAGAAAAIGAVAVPLLAVGAVFSFFKKKTKELDSGLRIAVTGMDALVQTFNKTETKRFWGLSKKVRTSYRDASAALADPIKLAVSEIQTGVIDAASAMGIGADAFEGFSHTLQVSTKGLSAEAAQNRVEKAFKGLGNAFSDMIPQLERYARAGEDSLDAVTRLSAGLTAVNDTFDLLGRNLLGLSLAGAGLATDLADEFGGLEPMAAAVNAYFGAFYSEGERSATLLRRLGERFADLGIVMPTSRDQFRELVDGIDVTTESGRKLYAGMLGLSGAMNEVLPAVAQFTAEMSGLLGEVGGEIGSYIETARRMAQDAVAAANLWHKTAGTLRDFVSGLVSSGLSGASRDQSEAVLRDRYETAFASARSGDVEAAQSIPELARAYLQSVQAGAASALEYRRIAAQVQGQVALAAGIADLEASNDEILQGLYEQQIEVLTGLGNFLKLDGLTDEQVGELSQGVQDLAADWDGTVQSFEDSLGALETAIREAEAFSYDDLVGRLDVAVTLDDGAPGWLRKLVERADSGIRTTLDFIIRRDDLTATDRWLATTALSEHVSALDFVLRSDLDPNTRKMVLQTAGDLRRTMKIDLGKDLDPQTRTMVLAKAANLSRRINVALTKDGQKTIGILTRVKEMIGGKGDGSIVFDGGIKLSAGVVFENVNEVASGLVAPMDRLRGMLGELRDQVRLDRLQREAELKRQKILGLQAKGKELKAEIFSGVGGQSVLNKISALERSTGVTLQADDGSAPIWMNPDGTIGYTADWVSYHGGSNLEKWKSQFWAAGGLEDQIFAYNKQIGQDRTALTALREQIRGLGAVPGFAAGGFHMGGPRIVGERGWEIENTGASRIHSHAESVGMLDNRQVVRSVQEMSRQVAAQGQTMEMFVRRIAQYMETWDEAGQPEVRA